MKLTPNGKVLVVLMFDRDGYYGCALGSNHADVRAAAEQRSKNKQLVACTIPFEGTWSVSGMPDISLPPDMRPALADLDHGVNE